ncbi:3-hydroxy-fatty acyl-ACP dehydratase [Gilliamella sp. W8128]|uniref:ApeP family dehydratase n=1 Tax=Gilliamella sp. W8128 TaxID=2751010 RepID=UPI0018DC4414|nr:3-hydroxy-fatty acyl-ACP dehydratase [Gilliamella sp. W8128]MBI0153386.1 3-hydroxy-fatty acyl-ACP dehydratase [Gilliamella sp. W8128]
MQYQSVNSYLPHKTPMIMIDKVHLVNNEQSICSVKVTKDGILSPFLNRDNQLPNFFAIELMAQTIGVWNGYHDAKKNHSPQLGMLLGGRAIKNTLPAFPLNSELLITANLVLFDTKLANFDCQITINQQCVSSGKLNVYEPDHNELDQLFGSQRLGGL